MNTKRITRLAGLGLSGLLIVSFVMMSAGMLFALAPASPAGAVNGPDMEVTRHLPETVEPGETFEVSVTFTAPADEFTVAMDDYAPDVPGNWLVTADGAWSTPPADAVTALDNKVEIMWLPPPIGESPPFPEDTEFTVVYRVTVPDDVILGVYEFGAGRVEYYIDGAGPYPVPITGDYQVEIAKPNTVWVNDDWVGLGEGDDADGYIFGYNAFATIQDGIDGVAGSTVHVLPGEYDGFLVEDRHGLSIIGQDGAVVTDGFLYDEPFIMAVVANSTDIAISGLEFDGSAIGEEDFVVGIGYVGSTGSINGVTVRDVLGYYMGIGIAVIGGDMTTVDISNTRVHDCPVGVMVQADRVNLTNCNITGIDGYGGVGIAAVAGAVVHVDDCEISGFRIKQNGPPQIETLSFGTTQENGMPPQGIGIVVVVEAPDGTEPPAESAMVNGGDSQVTVTGCSKIFNNDIGIVVHPGGYLDISHSNIEDNDFGIYNDGGEANAERNWWGDDRGPEHEDNPFYDVTTGDAVSDNVSYIPWLDAPCPQGMPVGPTAYFVGDPTEGVGPLEVQFTDLSVGSADADIVSWFWQFGDGTTSTEQHPIHSYDEVGTYTVTLTVTDELGLSNTATRQHYIEVLRERRPIVEPEPAKLVTSYILVSPEYVVPDQTVEISVNLINIGGTEGTGQVDLYINGHFEEGQTVTVPAGSAKLVVFEVTRRDPGAYHVSVEGNPGQFFVQAEPDRWRWDTDLGTGGIIAIVVIALALVVGLVLVFRRR